MWIYGYYKLVAMNSCFILRAKILHGYYSLNVYFDSKLENLYTTKNFVVLIRSVTAFVEDRRRSTIDLFTKGDCRPPYEGRP